jgi:ATP-binding cassette subfamily F protein 3
MANLLEIRGAFKRYGEQVLLEDASAVITDQFKIGLIGRNGAGKSTLCRILLGEEELDSGEVIRHPDLRLGYLRQHDPFEPGEKVIEFLLRDSEQPEWRCGEVAAQFELKGPQLEREVKELSGGWQTRVKLAALLLHDPNLLLLDEPTNFLDLRTQLLLEEFLRTFREACVVVSHDRAFLKDTCDRTLELSRGRLTMFPGNVDVYMEHIQMRREHDEKVNASVQSKRKQLETFIAKNRANAATASQARSKAKQLERLELTDIEAPESSVYIRMPEVETRKGSVLRTKDLAMGYPDHTVAENIELDLEHGQRIAIVGDNGQGKTTFLRTVTGSLDPHAGHFKWGHGCDTGVYAQHVYTTLPSDDTVFEYLQRRSTADVKTQMILNLAGSFLFRGENVNKKVKVLSGGERARLCLAGLLLGKHNVLVLDEPGNHLDVETVEALADAMTRYQGTIIFTSHDRYFMHRVATSVIEVRDGRVAMYTGSYDDYVYRVEKEIEEGQRDGAPSMAVKAGAAPAPGKTPVPTKNAGDSPADKEAKKALARKQYELGKELNSLERQIEKHEQRKQEFEAQLKAATSSADATRIQGALAEVKKKLAPIEARWVQVQEELEKK